MDITLPIIVGIFVGVASGYLGSFMILRRMSLVGDALSHVALPGFAVAALFNINPFLGAFGALFLGIFLIWLIENKTQLPTETLVGVLFAFSLAVGLLIVPDEELLEALFGDIASVQILDAVLAVILSVVVLTVMSLISKKLILGTLSSDIAKSQKIKITAINFIFLLLVATIVALGIKVVGTLLMGALVIIPAAAAKNFSSSMDRFASLSSVFGIISAVGGILIANSYGLLPGPMVVLFSSLVFLVSLFAKRQ